MIFRRRRLGDACWTVNFGAAGGLLTYWVLRPERIVLLLDLTWVDDRRPAPLGRVGTLWRIRRPEVRVLAD
jgi:hypothetical protein